MIGAAGAADDAQENLFEREFLARSWSRYVSIRGRTGHVQRSGRLRLHARAKFFQGTLRNQLAAMDDGHMTAKALDNF